MEKIILNLLHLNYFITELLNNKYNTVCKNTLKTAISNIFSFFLEKYQDVYKAEKLSLR